MMLYTYLSLNCGERRSRNNEERHANIQTNIRAHVRKSQLSSDRCGIGEGQVFLVYIAEGHRTREKLVEILGAHRASLHQRGMGNLAILT
jgi:hypothetical protein